MLLVSLYFAISIPHERSPAIAADQHASPALVVFADGRRCVADVIFDEHARKRVRFSAGVSKADANHMQYESAIGPRLSRLRIDSFLHCDQPRPVRSSLAVSSSRNFCLRVCCCPTSVAYGSTLATEESATVAQFGFGLHRTNCVSRFVGRQLDLETLLLRSFARRARTF